LVTIRTFFFEELDAGRDMFNLLMQQYPYASARALVARSLAPLVVLSF
jgi:hypothetical protein